MMYVQREVQGAEEYAAMVADMEDVYSHAAPAGPPLELAPQPSPADQLRQEKVTPKQQQHTTRSDVQS